MRSALTNVMMKAVDKTFKQIAKDFREIEQLQLATKPSTSFIEHSYANAEQQLVYFLQQGRDDWGIISPHVTHKSSSGHYFIIDAINGLDNFSHGNPHICISLAAQEKIQGKNIITHALLCQPLTGELYWAERARGAFYDNGNFQQRMRVAGKDAANMSLLGLYHPSILQADDAQHYEHMLNASFTLSKQGFHPRFSGCPALDYAYLAEGRIDGLYHQHINFPTMAAGMLLASEAGAAISYHDGKPIIPLAPSTHDIIAGNSAIHAVIKHNVIT